MGARIRYPVLLPTGIISVGEGVPLCCVGVYHRGVSVKKMAGCVGDSARGFSMIGRESGRK